jgi:hypothetical protein
MTTGKDSSGLGRGLAVLGAAAVLALCCAGPVLIAGGALGVAGGVLRSGWLIGAAVVVVLAAVGYTVHRRTDRHRRPDPHGGRAPVRLDTATSHPERSVP